MSFWVSQVPETTDSVEFERGGFWRRALALFIDLIAVCIVLEAVALALFPLSDGRLQLTSGFAFPNCQKLLAPPDGITLPAEFVPTSILDCQRTVFGLPVSRMLVAAKIVRDGAITRINQIPYMLDRQGKPVYGWSLDVLVLPLLIALRLWLDRGQGSPGRRICRIRLSSRSGAQMSHAAMTKRYVAQVLPLLPILLWSVYVTVASPGPQLFDNPWVLISVIGAGVPSLIAVLEALASMVGGKDAYYDRLAGTCVLRLDINKAVIPVQVQRTSTNTRDPLTPSLEPEALGAAAIPAAAGSRNYFRRHWRGELSLPVSYWLNGFLIGVVVGVGFVLVKQLSSGSNEARPLLWLVSLSAAWVLAVLLTIWQAVGVWRSATRYQQAGNSLWGGAAKVSMTLGVIRLAFTLVAVGVPQLAGIYEIVDGDARVGAHEFHVLGNGRVLEFSGGITFGVAQELERFLNAMEGVKVVRLNSLGGRITEAQRMSNIIKSRGLSTYVLKDCLSACTVAFMGGKERVIAPTARLGFHQPNFRGMTAEDRGNAIEVEVQRLQRLGLSKAFAERANSAAPNAMWYPDQAELIRERVATRMYQPPKPALPKAAPSPSLPASGADATEKPVAIAPSPADAPPQANASSADDAVAPPPPRRLETGQALIPADLMKRLAAQPRKPAPAPALNAGQQSGISEPKPAPPQ
jgi:uncharacterized RDD family membrane protein YckC